MGPQRFRFATAAGDTGVERDETCVRVSFLPVASTSPRRSSPPVRRPMYHLKFLAVAKVEVARPVHLAEFVHLPEATCRRKDQVAAADNRVAAGRDLQDHELVAAARADGSQPMRSAELKKLRAGRGNVFKHWDGVAVDRRGKRQRRNLPGVCLAL